MIQILVWSRDTPEPAQWYWYRSNTPHYDADGQPDSQYNVHGSVFFVTVEVDTGKLIAVAQVNYKNENWRGLNERPLFVEDMQGEWALVASPQVDASSITLELIGTELRKGKRDE